MSEECAIKARNKFDEVLMGVQVPDPVFLCSVGKEERWYRCSTSF